MQEELIYIKDFLDEQNEEQLKHVDKANMVKDIDRLLKKLSHYANVLDELTHSVHKDIKQLIHHRIWYLTSGFVSGAICASLFSTWYPVPIIAAYFSGVAFVGYCYDAYISAGQALKRSRLLQGPVVQKPINANPRLKINQGVYYSTTKCCSTLIFGKTLH